MPIACGTSEFWHDFQGVVTVSLGEVKELPMALRVAGTCAGCRAAGSGPAAEELPARAEDEELQTVGI